MLFLVGVAYVDECSGFMDGGLHRFLCRHPSSAQHRGHSGLFHRAAMPARGGLAVAALIIRPVGGRGESPKFYS